MSEQTFICKRCAGPIPAVEFMEVGYHKHIADCVVYQAEKIALMEKQLARANKTISSLEATVEMLNAVVGRMLG